MQVVAASHEAVCNIEGNILMDQATGQRELQSEYNACWSCQEVLLPPTSEGMLWLAVT